MAEEKIIDVAGYAKRVYYNDNIEYRNFSPNLVGNQSTGLSGDASIFTRGNFSVTTNVSTKVNKIFKQGEFSQYLTLEDVTKDDGVLTIEKNSRAQLNLDLTDPLQYVWYGSFVEFNRVSLEDIQKRWPAAIYVDNKVGSVTGNSVTSYNYDGVKGETTFKVNSKYFYNPFLINYTEDYKNAVDNSDDVNTLRNLSLSSSKYIIEYGGKEYKITDFTGSTQKTNSDVTIKVEGNPFVTLTNIDGSSLSTEGSLQYLIKPNEVEIETFFSSLSEYQRNILNRNTYPIYKSTFSYPVNGDGAIIYQEKTVNFPLTKDGYNLNFFDGLYLSFLKRLDDITTSFDLNQTNLMVRKYTAEVINSFDTIPRGDGDDLINNGQKMTDVLNIYGREFDEVKKYITGIKYAHVVTYNKNNNTPDVLIKDLAKMLGFEGFALLESLDINKIFLPSEGVEGYSGQTVMSSNKEVETEVYRRIILNIAWLWKSKGTRKAVEYLFRLIGAPESVVVFDEHVYVADKPIDVDEIKRYLRLYNVEYDEDLFPFDSDGYPKPPLNTNTLYYQSFGGWYRRTGGNSPGIDLTEGNNPHVGKYDGGDAYIRQFTDIIPRFSPETNVKETNVVVDNVFINHNNGIFNGITNVNNLYLTLLEGRNNQVLTNVVDVDFTLENNRYRQPGGNTTAESEYNAYKKVYDAWTNPTNGILKNNPEERYSPEWQRAKRNYEISLKKFARETNSADCGVDKCLSLTVTKKNIIDEDYKKFRRVDFGPYIYYIDETGDKTYFEDFPERCVADGGKFRTYENQKGRETAYCAKSAPCSHSQPIGLDKNNYVIFSVGGSNNSEVEADNKQSDRTKVSSPECCSWYNYDYVITKESNVYCLDSEGITESEVMDIEEQLEILRKKKIRLQLEIDMASTKGKDIKTKDDGGKILAKDLQNIEDNTRSGTYKSKSKTLSGGLKSLSDFNEAAPSGNPTKIINTGGYGQAVPSGNSVRSLGAAGQAAPSGKPTKIINTGGYGQSAPPFNMGGYGQAAPSGNPIPTFNMGPVGGQAAPSGNPIPTFNMGGYGQAAPSGNPIPTFNMSPVGGQAAPSGNPMPTFASTNVGSPSRKYGF